MAIFQIRSVERIFFGQKSQSKPRLARGKKMWFLTMVTNTALALSLLRSMGVIDYVYMTRYDEHLKLAHVQIWAD